MNTNTFTSKDFAMDKEYRNRQQQYAQRRRMVATAFEARKSESKKAEVETVNEETSPARLSFAAANKLSTVSVVVSLVLLVLVFVASSSTSVAQEMLDDTSGPNTAEQAAGLDLMLAVLHLENGNFNKAQAKVDRALEAFPDLAAGYTLRSAVNVYAGNYELAATDAALALALDETEVSAHYFLAEAHFATGNFVAAQQSYEAYLIAAAASERYENALVERLVGDDYEVVVLAQVDACEAQQVAMEN